MKLERKYVEKPWGRTLLPSMFGPPENTRIGEVWFTADKPMPLLAKYIFTSEALSIQVHPDDQQARARGLESGKAECWYILETDPEAVLGLGLNQEMTDEELRSAALDGSIEQMISWRRVRAGDFILVPPGTIHAIGAGVSLIEFQQNADVTYRLYDYGRPRELHLEDGVAVSTRKAFDSSLVRHVEAQESRLLTDEGPFKLASGTDDCFTGEDRWIIPLRGCIHLDGETARPGEILFARAGADVAYEDAWALTGARS